MPPAPATPPQKPTGSGPVIGIIVIVIMLIFGALYFWGAQLNKTSEPLPLIPDNATSTQ
ncbi:MAG: hypothetical protein JO019_00335 [Candidatus Kaiserbacteria bacterium]|nr:hypothetical protein [Candidatus Kaiserbacteria bacterium]